MSSRERFFGDTSPSSLSGLAQVLTMMVRVLLVALTLAPAAHAQTESQTYTESILYNFCSQPNCIDGQTPAAGLAMDSLGHLYGTTSSGGDSAEDGTVFKLIVRDGVGFFQTILHSFPSPSTTDGAYPAGGLVMDKAGNLYGTTGYGGQNCFGTIFKLTPQ